MSRLIAFTYLALAVCTISYRRSSGIRAVSTEYSVHLSITLSETQN